MTAAVALMALAVALIALVAAVSAWLTARTAGTAIRTLASARADRRQRNQGPPAGVEDRRRHRDPQEGRARRSAVDDPQWRVDEPEQGPATPSGVGSANYPDVRRTDRPEDVHADDPSTYPPRPTPRHRHPDEPETSDMRALPPPGSITR